MKRTRPGPAKPVRGGLPPRRERPTGASPGRRKARAAANPANSSHPLSAGDRACFENTRQGAFFPQADGALMDVPPAGRAVFDVQRQLAVGAGFNANRSEPRD